jgi:DNA-directed RNA polymerase specialized sigma24 family protein
MSTFDLAIPGGGSDDTWEELKKILNTIIRKRLCDLRLLRLRNAVFTRSCNAIPLILRTSLESAAKTAIEHANGYSRWLLQVMVLIVDQTIDEIAAERQIMIACPRPRTVDVLSHGAAPLDHQESREHDPAEIAEFKQLEEILMSALDRLSLEKGYAFLMKINGFSLTEIMTSQGISRSTAYDQIKDTKEALFEVLKDYRER